MPKQNIRQLIVEKKTYTFTFYRKILVVWIICCKIFLDDGLTFKGEIFQIIRVDWAENF